MIRVRPIQRMLMEWTKLCGSLSWSDRTSFHCSRQFHKQMGFRSRSADAKIGSADTDMSRIRNIGIIAHIDAGKTTTTERMLYYSGTTRHLGDVDKGDTVMDFMDEERERGITINSAAISFLWNKHNVNLIDTPGHVDFTLEVERSLRVLDGAVTILDASAGVEAQTMTVWRQAERYSIPQIVFLNKMDKFRASFDKSINSVRTKLKAVPVAIQLPIGCEGDFEGVIDIITMHKLLWGKGQTMGLKYTSSPLTPTDGDFWTQACEARATLIEHLADLDDVIANYVLGDVDMLTIPVHDVVHALRHATLQRALVPTLCGSSLKNKGVQPLLDAVVHYLPGPTEVHHDLVSLYRGELCALAFKIASDKQRGLLTFVRLYEGQLSANSSIYNVTRQVSEKVGRIVRVSADEYKDVGSASAGQIVALSGLKETITGDMLVSSMSVAKKIQKKYSEKHSEDNITGETPSLPGLIIPDPVFFCSIEPPSLSQQRALEQALVVLTREDPSLRVRYDEETGQTILAGMGELHLEVTHHRIQNEFKVDADLGPLQIAYRESISQSKQLSHVLEQTLGDKHHKVTLTLSVHPAGGAGIQHEMKIIPSQTDEFLRKYLRRHHINAINSGLSAGLGRGPVLGFQVTDVEVQLHELTVGRGTSMPMLTAAISQAICEALKSASPSLLEPIVNLEIDMDESHQGRVMNDLAQRRSHIVDVQMQDDRRTIVSHTPLSELLGYSTWLRTMTSGTAVFTMEVSSYEPMTEQEQCNAVRRITGFYPA